MGWDEHWLLLYGNQSDNIKNYLKNSLIEGDTSEHLIIK